MKKYLYGLKVQGIQSFIFQTNKLTEIIGGSELVEIACGDFFNNLLIEKGIDKGEFLMNAAGNVKYIFYDKDSCEKIYEHLPRALSKRVPGLSFVHAVEEYDDILDESVIKRIEFRLNELKNNPLGLLLPDYMIFQKARRTGLPAIANTPNAKKDEFIDCIQDAKREAANLSAVNNLLKKMDLPIGRGNKRFPYEMDELVKQEEKNYIAVVHVDGNGLGQLIQQFTAQMKGKDITAAFSRFSSLLDLSMKNAVKRAFGEVVLPAAENRREFPFRPVILGGDDFTAIMEARLAIDFTRILLEEFEIQTRNNYSGFAKEFALEGIFSNGLTACAGIAFIKANYPFHYGVDLSEILCKQAKKVSKSLVKDEKSTPAPSSLLFHRVQSGFIEDNYESIVAQELTAANGVRLDYGPYFVQNQVAYSSINQLLSRVNDWKKPDSPLSSLRNWLTELMFSPAAALQLQKRMMQIHQPDKLQALGFVEKFETRSDDNDYTSLFDVVTLCSILQK